MDRGYYLNIAQSDIRFPLGPDLTLHEHKDPEAILLDGDRLGQVVIDTAVRYNTPLAIPLMDLSVEQEALLTLWGVAPDEIDTFHFTDVLERDRIDALISEADSITTPRMTATCEAITKVSTQEGLLPVGMCIGPFSLMTKLLADPITGIYLLGAEMEDPSVEIIISALEMGTAIIKSYIDAQIKAGAKAIIVCEPAVSKIYISPQQMIDSDVFEKTVMRYLREIIDGMKKQDCDLILHDCGELTEDILIEFNKLDPAILTLGSTSVLWEVAPFISKQTVLYGNLPTKNFYSDGIITAEQVKEMSLELIAKMQEIDHPFILGSECDVLSVPEYNDIIYNKIDAMMSLDFSSIRKT